MVATIKLPGMGILGKSESAGVLRELERKRAALDIREQVIKEREQELLQLEKQVETTTEHSSEYVKKLEAKASSLKELDSLLKDKERQLEAQKAQIAQEKEELDKLLRKKAELGSLIKKGERAQTTIKDAAKTMQSLSEKESKLKELQNELKTTKDQLYVKEKEISKREKKYIHDELTRIKQQENMQKSVDMLKMQLNSLDLQVANKKSAFETMRMEWNDRLEELKAERDSIRQESNNIRNLIDSDMFALKKTESSIIEKINTVENDKQKIEDAENTIAKKMKEFEKAKKLFENQQALWIGKEASLSRKESELKSKDSRLKQLESRLNQQKAKIARVKEIKANLPLLEKKYGQLTTKVQRAVANLMGEYVDPSIKLTAKAHNLAEIESELTDQAYELNTKMRALKDEEPDAIERYIRHEVNSEMDVHKPIRKSSVVHDSIIEINNLVEQGRTDDAIRKLSEVEVEINSIRSPDEKRIVGYEIRDLKTRIKLALL